MKKSYKAIFGVLLAAALSLSVTACSSGNGSSSNTYGGSTKSVKTLTVLMHTSWYTAGAKAAINLFNSKYSTQYGAKLQIQKVPEGDAGDTEVRAQYAAGEVPDILYWYGAGSEFTASTTFAQLDPKAAWTKNFGSILNQAVAYSIGGHLYGVPFGDQTDFVMFYNKNAFAKAHITGTPKTWSAFLSDCAKLKTAGVTPVFYSGKDSWTLQIFQMASKGAVGTKGTADMKALEANKMKWASLPFLANSITQMKQLVDKGYVNSTWLSDSYEQAQQALLNGTAAMYPQGTWLVPVLNQLNAKKVQSSIGAFVIPLNTNQKLNLGTTYSLFASKAGKNAALATKVIQFFGTTAAQNAWFQAQPGIPLIKGLSLKASGPIKDIVNVINSGNTVSDFEDFSTKGYSWNSNLASYIQEYLVGQIPAASVLQQCDADYAKQAKAKNDPDFK
jgi:ABC-type sugar transport system, periplasmic component